MLKLVVFRLALILTWMSFLVPAGDFVGYAAAADCQIQKAPGKFEFRESKSKSGNPSNVGIVPTGFVTLEDTIPVVHGIDVSKYQDNVDFQRIKECGARFAYVRLSAGSNPDNELEYPSLWANAKSVGLIVGPYHNLRLKDPNIPFQSLSVEAKEALGIENEAHARKQAQLFMSRLQDMLLLDPDGLLPDKNSLGEAYLPAVLDISWRPQARFSAEDQRDYGLIYKRGICAWIDEFTNDPRFSKQKLILFTSAYIYKDYQIGTAACGVSKLSVWITDHTVDGGRSMDNPRAATRDVVELLCRDSDGKDRCIIQQYTSFGGFALFQDRSGLDMNRFYGTMDDPKRLLQHATKPKERG